MTTERYDPDNCRPGPRSLFGERHLPVGLMIAGPRFSEGKVLAHAFEQATDFHSKKPPIRAETPVPPLATTDEEREKAKGW